MIRVDQLDNGLGQIKWQLCGRLHTLLGSMHVQIVEGRECIHMGWELETDLQP